MFYFVSSRTKFSVTVELEGYYSYNDVSSSRTGKTQYDSTYSFFRDMMLRPEPTVKEWLESSNFSHVVISCPLHKNRDTLKWYPRVSARVCGATYHLYAGRYCSNFTGASAPPTLIDFRYGYRAPLVSWLLCQQ